MILKQRPKRTRLLAKLPKQKNRIVLWANGEKYLIETIFEYKGYTCVVTGHPYGHRCGYVKLDKPNDPQPNTFYDFDNIYDLDCHWGITYCSSNSIYPILTLDECKWIGFDCAHAYDGKETHFIEMLNDNPVEKKLALHMAETINKHSSSQIRSNEYVVEQCKSIVDQIIEGIKVEE